MPGILEWPAVIKENRETYYPAYVSDYLPTVLDVLGAVQRALCESPAPPILPAPTLPSSPIAQGCATPIPTGRPTANRCCL